MYPTLPEDEQAETGAYGSESLDDKEKVGAEPEDINRNTAGDTDAKGATDRAGTSAGGASNTAGRRSGGATSGTGDRTGGGSAESQPGGPSGDAAAAGRANPNAPAKPRSSEKGSSGGLGAGVGLPGGIGGSGGGKGKSSLSSRAKKRIGIALATALVSGLLAFVSFFGLLEEELVHFEENVVHYFDKRMGHSLSQRAGPHWQQIMDKVKGRKGAGDADSGDPIADADANYNISELDSTAGLTANYDSAGNITSFTDAAGDKLDASSSSLDNPDSPLMEDITSHEPEGSFYRESIRSFTLDDAWGIVRKFLPSREDTATDDPTEIDTELDQNFTATDENTNGAPEAESSEEDGAKTELEGEVSNAETDATAAVGPASTVYQICGAEGISQSVKKTLWIIRVAQLMRISNGIVLPTAHQLKVGDVKASWLAAFMKHFSGFSTAGGWQNLDPSTKTNQVSDTEKSQFAAEPSGNLVNVTNALDKTSPVCGPINSTGILGPLLLDLSELDPEEDGILAALQTAVGSITKNVLGGKVLSYIAGQATDAASKPIIALATATGADLANATISGYDNYSNQNAMSNGGERLSASQVAVLNNEADHADIQGAQQQGPLYALFSPNYDRSLTSALILKAPTSTSDVADGFNSALATISSPFSPSQLSVMGSFIASRIPFANADNLATDSEDPSGMGVPQMGLPDSLLAQYPNPEANEKWVINYVCNNPDSGTPSSEWGLYDGQCAGTSKDDSGELTGQNDSHQDPFHDFVRLCLAPTDYAGQAYLTNSECTDETTEVYQRFRVYRFDLGVANMINSYNNDNDDQNPNGSGSGTAPVTTGTGSTAGYVNPLTGIQGLTPERLDQGVDYSGTGPLYALGAGTVINVNAPAGSGWGPNNIYISYILSGGTAAGYTVYAAECINPSVHVGDILHAGQVIGTMTDCGSGIEMGWSQPSKGDPIPASRDLPMAPGLVDCSGNPSTGLGSVKAEAFAVNFSTLLQALGAPGGTYQCGQGATHGTLPSGWPAWN